MSQSFRKHVVGTISRKQCEVSKKQCMEMSGAPISGPSCPSTIRLRWREYIWSSAEPQTQSEVTWQNMAQGLATLQNTKVQYSSFTVKALLAQCTSRASTRRVYFISIIFWVQYINHNNNTYFNIFYIYMQT